jgi:hypothetical protein
MGFKDQLIKIKDNWFIVVLVLILVVFVVGSGSIGSMSLSKLSGSAQSSGYNSYDSLSNGAYRSSGIGGSADFAPQVQERKIVKSTSLSSEVERGTFKNAEDKLNNIVKSSDSFLLSSSSGKSGTDDKGYFSGSYSIKVDTAKYDSVIAQLKEIGKVTYFNENAIDITGSYTNTNIEIAAEKEKLRRYNELYGGLSTSTSDKVDLVDKIFNEERTIKYLEDSIANMDQRVEYSTIQVTLTEKRSNYADVALAKFSALVKSLVASFNGLLYFLFVIAPWVVLGLIIWLIARTVKRKA